MQIFYSTQISNNTIWLVGDEFNHCKNVLRLKNGEEVKVADGKGNFYECKIGSFTKEKAELHIICISETSLRINNFTLQISIAPTKNIDRIEWFVEKAVEIGVDEISFLVSKRCERKIINIERLEKIAVSAMKQSGKAWLPTLNALVPFEKYMDNQANKGVKLIAHLVEGQQREELKDALLKYINQETSFELLIGPEGDFTPDEVNLALKKGYIPVSLGTSRLRTETAGVMGCAIFSVVLG